MDLKQLIEENWDKKAFISLALKKDKVKEIVEATSFLNGIYSKVSLRSRAYVIKHNLSLETLPKCPCCSNYSTLNNSNPELGFRTYCSPKCSRSDKTINKNLIELFDNYEFLYQEKIVKQKSIEQIAEEHQVSITPVVKYLKKYNLYQLNDARKLNENKINLLSNYTFMYDLYVSRNYTLRQMGKIVGCSTGVIKKYLTFHNIKISNPNSYPRKFNKVSNEEKEIFEFISQFEPHTVEQSNRTLLNGSEVDIYIPDKKVAFEYNGIYSHLYRRNETTPAKIKGQNYHLNKTLKLKKLGINLYQIYSNEWNYNKSIIKNFIIKKLKLTKIVKVDNSSIIEETRTNNNKVVSLVINDTKILSIEFTLYKDKIIFRRHYTAENITLNGGFKKLLDYIKSKFKTPIYVKIDRRYSEGRLLTSYGFIIEKIIPPKIMYTDNSYDKLYTNRLENKTNYGIYNCGFLILKCK